MLSKCKIVLNVACAQFEVTCNAVSKVIRQCFLANTHYLTVSVLICLATRGILAAFTNFQRKLEL